MTDVDANASRTAGRPLPLSRIEGSRRHCKFIISIGFRQIQFAPYAYNGCKKVSSAVLRRTLYRDGSDFPVASSPVDPYARTS